MSIEISRLERDEFDRWDGIVDRSPDTNLFHRSDALALQAEYSSTELHPLVGFKGQEPVGIWPVFERRKGPFTAVFSPPPPLWIHRLGPAMVNQDKLKRRKRDRRTRRFVDGCFEWLADHCDPQYVRTTTEEGYCDLRPFKWNDADVTPVYTYVVDLDRDREDLLAAFSSDARKNVTDVEAEYAIEVGDADDAERILEQVRARYEAQDEGFAFPDRFARDLVTELPDGLVRPYCCYHEGEYVGGILTFEDDRRIHRWHGGVKTDVDLPVNDLLDWHVMTDAMERDIEQYDLVGADDRRISGYKAKFAPSLVTLYRVERGSLPVKAMLDIYKRVR